MALESFRMSEISLKPARTVAEWASTRQHQEKKLTENHGARGGGCAPAYKFLRSNNGHQAPPTAHDAVLFVV